MIHPECEDRERIKIHGASALVPSWLEHLFGPVPDELGRATVVCCLFCGGQGRFPSMRMAWAAAAGHRAMHRAVIDHQVESTVAHLEAGGR